jgi:decaprenylphospho-beta-D-ribofuranose 2-oxidase
MVMETADQGFSLPIERRQLSGWGRTPTVSSDVATPYTCDDVVQLLGQADGRGVIPRGLGRAYGDAAQRAGGLVLDMTQLDSIGPVDRRTGLVVVDGGVSIDQLMRKMLPQGWFVPVTPGTRSVTIGGAIAADIHGKNHHRDGSFCTHVTSMTLVTPTGVLEVTPQSDPELFWATAGGMGLTGIVVKATVRMLPVESSWVTVDTHRFSNLDDLMSEMEMNDHRYHYSVAWVDCNAGGKRRGRSILTRGDHAGRDRVEHSSSRDLHQELSRAHLKVPLQAPKGLLNMASVTAFNEMWFRRAPKARLDELQHIGTFFHPLDGVTDWNLLYGPNGFLQYQFAVSDQHGDVVQEAVDLVRTARVPSFVAVLKRFGPGDEGPLSFPIAGWTLALDFPVGPAALPDLVEALDDLVLNAGGRVYLAKDSRAHPEQVHKMYPRIPELQSVRDRIDPDRVLQSDLSLRLDI